MIFGLFKSRRPRDPAPPGPQRDRLVPRLKHVDFAHALDQAGVPAQERPPITPLCGDLVVTYAFDGPERFEMASPALLKQARIKRAEVARLALDNLGRQLPAPGFFEKQGCGIAHTGKGLESTLLLLDAAWAPIEARLKGELLAAVPRRDRLIVCDSANQAATLALHALAAAGYAERRDEHALSAQVMVRRGGTWALYQP